MKVDLKVERVGRSHAINIDAYIGLKPGWQEADQAAIASSISASIAEAIKKQLPKELRKHTK